MPSRLPITTPTGEVVIESVYDVDELAALLGTSTRTIRRRIAAGLWPYVRTGPSRGPYGRVVFTRDHVRLIVAAYNQTHDYPAHEPQQGELA